MAIRAPDGANKPKPVVNFWKCTNWQNVSYHDQLALILGYIYKDFDIDMDI